MIKRGKHSILGIRIAAVDYEAVVQQVVDAAQQGRALAVSALAVHGLMTGALDATHRFRLNRFDLLVPDGQPVRWALNWLYRAGLPDRVYGPRLMFEICRCAADEGYPVFLFGGSDELLGDLRRKLTGEFPTLQIAGVRSSRFRTLSPSEKEELSQEIRASGARIAFVGLGCPRQEVFVYEHRDALNMPLIAVGAAFNFHSGRLAQAPPVMQRWGLEWLFRLVTEPKRLWRRYVLLNPLYVALVLLQAVGVYRVDPDKARPPQCEVCYG